MPAGEVQLLGMWHRTIHQLTHSGRKSRVYTRFLQPPRTSLPPEVCPHSLSPCCGVDPRLTQPGFTGSEATTPQEKEDPSLSRTTVTKHSCVLNDSPTLAFPVSSVNFTFRLQGVSFVLLLLQGAAGHLLSLDLGDLGC